MRKLQILGAFVAVLAFSALTVASASATLWLREGRSVLVQSNASTHGELLLHHTGGLAGTIQVLCTGLAHGTVATGGNPVKDETTEILGLNGERNKVECVVHEGNALCAAGTKVTVTALNLPWRTELLLEPPLTTDHIVGTRGEAGYSTECKGISVTCTRNELIHFDENLVNGALFLFLETREKEASCSDGGRGTVGGMVEVLGFQVS